MQKNSQLSLYLPFTLSVKLDKPLYFLNKRVKCGVITHVALNKGEHTLQAIHKHGSLYHVTDQHGGEFEIELKINKDGYQFKSIPTTIYTKNINDFRLDGANSSGHGLRRAQLGAVYALLSHWSLTDEVATIVLPTGTGKTETMFVTALGAKATKTLVVVPTIDLKRQTTDKFSTWGILRDLGIISGLTPNPIILTLNSSIDNITAIDEADVIVTTPGLIARANSKIKDEIKTKFSHIYFDEAHHIEASEWRELRSLFSSAKIVQFTATPYRNDRKPVEGKIVYNYSLSRALVDECFSKISLISIDQRHPKLKDKAIADAAMDRLIEDRKRGWIKHKMMVRTDKKERAEALFLNYQEWFPKERIVVVHSKTKRKKSIIDDIKNGKYDIVICVDMLKEGFDFPDFKIAAVHKLHQSLGVLLQFIGRFARTRPDLGDASFIVNFADERLSIELENLLQEGSGWEYVISEIADAKKADAESLLSFLQGCEPFSGFDSPNIELNPKLVYPALSCVCFRCDKVEWGNFKDAFNLSKYSLTQPYFNQKENVFYFTTQTRERVKWAKSNKMRDQKWDLIVMHFAKDTGLLYVGYSDKLLDVKELVRCITTKEPKLLNGDCVFRSFDSIKRLSIVHAGIFKPSNHLHRYSRLSGADVTTELTRWREGKRCQKSDFVGIGFRDGFPISVGASVKGKIWSPARIGDLKEWKAWCLNIGKLITDETINSNQLLEDSAEKIQLDRYPDNLIALATDWSEILYDKIHKISVDTGKSQSVMLSECTLRNISVTDQRAEFIFHILDQEITFSIVLGGEKGHSVEGLDDSNIMIDGLKTDPLKLKNFFEENPPTIFLLDGCTISGSIQTNYNTSVISRIPSDQIETLTWDKVSYKTESMYKKGVVRENSVQEYMMKRLVDLGAKIVFNDDNSGESADIVAIFHKENIIRFEMIHCKYSKDSSGARLEDLFEVCGQAIVSLRYKWKPEELLKHMERRNGTGVLKGKRFYHGDLGDVESMKKAIRYTNVEFEFAVAQPGVKTSDITDDMMNFLGSIYSTVVEMTETKLKCYFNSR